MACCTKELIGLEKEIMPEIQFMSNSHKSDSRCLTLLRHKFAHLFLLFQELSAEDLRRAVVQTYELAEQCFRINYDGAKATAEALISVIRLSDSPRIVNVSSSAGKLEVCKQI